MTLTSSRVIYSEMGISELSRMRNLNSIKCLNSNIGIAKQVNFLQRYFILNPPYQVPREIAILKISYPGYRRETKEQTLKAVLEGLEGPNQVRAKHNQLQDKNGVDFSLSTWNDQLPIQDIESTDIQIVQKPERSSSFPSERPNYKLLGVKIYKWSSAHLHMLWINYLTFQKLKN